MPATTTLPKPHVNLDIPKGLEWLANVADRDAERSHAEIIREIIADQKQAAKKSPK